MYSTRFLATLVANIDNDKLSETEFREFVRKSLKDQPLPQHYDIRLPDGTHVTISGKQEDLDKVLACVVKATKLGDFLSKL